MKNQIDKIKSLPNQQGNNKQEEEEKVNPLLRSQFAGKQTSQEPNREEQKESGWSYNSISNKLKFQINSKVLIVCVAVFVMFWLWKGGYKKLRNIGLFKFILKHVFGIKDKS